MSKEVLLSESYINLIKDNFNAPLVSNSDLNATRQIYLDIKHSENCFSELQNNVGSLTDKKILEVGSGYGLMLALGCNKYNYNYFGLEPSKAEYEGRFEISQVLLQENNLPSSRIICGIGEKMPFEDNSFDVVFSFQVLEHVKDPLQVLKESWRVLKKGGTLYINAPNYNYFYEGHYHIFWIPGMPKWISKIYLKLLGKDSTYIGHINFLTPRLIKTYLESISGEVVKSDFGLNDWVLRMQNSKFSDSFSPKLKKIYFFAKNLGLVSLIVFCGKFFNWQDTIRVALIKK